jgi:hypothetical protein
MRWNASDSFRFGPGRPIRGLDNSDR